MFRWILIFLSSTVLLLCFIYRTTLLCAIGDFLISEDRLEKADAVFVLGGDSYDRGNYAAEIYRMGYVSQIVCLGENVPTIFKAIGISYSESEVTKINIVSPFSDSVSITHLRKPIPDSSVIILKQGTSTKEEMDAIKEFCHKNNFKKIILVSSRFHTGRVRMISEKIFENSGIELLIAGAPSSFYREEEWWKSEEGLIMVNNEYVKHGYYLIKY